MHWLWVPVHLVVCWYDSVSVPDKLWMSSPEIRAPGYVRYSYTAMLVPVPDVPWMSRLYILLLFESARYCLWVDDEVAFRRSFSTPMKSEYVYTGTVCITHDV